MNNALPRVDSSRNFSSGWYSGDAYHRFACSTLGNSIMTYSPPRYVSGSAVVALMVSSEKLALTSRKSQFAISFL